MRYNATEVRIGSMRYWGVWDNAKYELVNRTWDELRNTKQEAQTDADQLNAS